MYGSNRDRCHRLPRDGSGKWSGVDQYRPVKSSNVGSNSTCCRCCSTCDYQQDLFKGASIISFAISADQCSIVKSIKALPLKKTRPATYGDGNERFGERGERLLAVCRRAQETHVSKWVGPQADPGEYLSLLGLGSTRLSDISIGNSLSIDHQTPKKNTNDR